MQVRVTESIGDCGCGRSPTGRCIGWHGLTESEYQEKQRLYAIEQAKQYGMMGNGAIIKDNKGE